MFKDFNDIGEGKLFVATSHLGDTFFGFKVEQNSNFVGPNKAYVSLGKLHDNEKNIPFIRWSDTIYNRKVFDISEYFQFRYGISQSMFSHSSQVRNHEIGSVLIDSDGIFILVGLNTRSHYVNVSTGKFRNGSEEGFVSECWFYEKISDPDAKHLISYKRGEELTFAEGYL